MLIDVDKQNREGTVLDDYEDWNSFDDDIGYFLQIDEKGKVKDVRATGSGVYSSGLWTPTSRICAGWNLNPPG